MFGTDKSTKTEKECKMCCETKDTQKARRTLQWDDIFMLTIAREIIKKVVGRILKQLGGLVDKLTCQLFTLLDMYPINANNYIQEC